MAKTGQRRRAFDLVARLWNGGTDGFDDTELQQALERIGHDPDAALHYLTTWAQALADGASQGELANRAAARLLVDLDRGVREHNRLPGVWRRRRRDEQLPEVVIQDGSLICPRCGAEDEIKEEDQALRWNDLHLSDDGFVFGSLGDSQFDHLRFLCGACEQPVDLPLPVEDYS